VALLRKETYNSRHPIGLRHLASIFFVAFSRQYISYFDCAFHPQQTQHKNFGNMIFGQKKRLIPGEVYIRKRAMYLQMCVRVLFAHLQGNIQII